jgi:hypothetical protein
VSTQSTPVSTPSTPCEYSEYPHVSTPSTACRSYAQLRPSRCRHKGLPRRAKHSAPSCGARCPSLHSTVAPSPHKGRSAERSMVRITRSRPRLDTGGMSGSSLVRRCCAASIAIAIAHGPHIECTQCCAHGASTIRARRHVPYRRRCLRAHPRTHVRGSARGSACVCACAPSCVRARGLAPHGRDERNEGALSTREYALACGVCALRPHCVRAGGLARCVAAGGYSRPITLRACRQCRVSTR